jgi:hypothetical protein
LIVLWLFQLGITCTVFVLTCNLRKSVTNC